MNVKELADLLFKVDMLGCADPVTGDDLAIGDSMETTDWFMRYSVELEQVSPFIPDRPPDATDPDGHVQWWQLENGVILAKFGEDPYGGGKIIPPDAGDPPPMKGFRWLEPGVRRIY